MKWIVVSGTALLLVLGGVLWALGHARDEVYRVSMPRDSGVRFQESGRIKGICADDEAWYVPVRGGDDTAGFYVVDPATGKSRDFVGFGTLRRCIVIPGLDTVIAQDADGWHWRGSMRKLIEGEGELAPIDTQNGDITAWIELDGACVLAIQSSERVAVTIAIVGTDGDVRSAVEMAADRDAKLHVLMVRSSPSRSSRRAASTTTCSPTPRNRLRRGRTG